MRTASARNSDRGRSHVLMVASSGIAEWLLLAETAEQTSPTTV